MSASEPRKTRRAPKRPARARRKTPPPARPSASEFNAAREARKESEEIEDPYCHGATEPGEAPEAAAPHGGKGSATPTPEAAPNVADARDSDSAPSSGDAADLPWFQDDGAGSAPDSADQEFTGEDPRRETIASADASSEPDDQAPFSHTSAQELSAVAESAAAAFDSSLKGIADPSGAAAEDDEDDDDDDDEDDDHEQETSGIDFRRFPVHVQLVDQAVYFSFTDNLPTRTQPFPVGSFRMEAALDESGELTGICIFADSTEPPATLPPAQAAVIERAMDLLKPLEQLLEALKEHAKNEQPAGQPTHERGEDPDRERNRRFERRDFRRDVDRDVTRAPVREERPMRERERSKDRGRERARDRVEGRAQDEPPPGEVPKDGRGRRGRSRSETPRDALNRLADESTHASEPGAEDAENPFDWREGRAETSDDRVDRGYGASETSGAHDLDPAPEDTHPSWETGASEESSSERGRAESPAPAESDDERGFDRSEPGGSEFVD